MTTTTEFIRDMAEAQALMLKSLVPPPRTDGKLLECLILTAEHLAFQLRDARNFCALFPHNALYRGMRLQAWCSMRALFQFASSRLQPHDFRQLAIAAHKEVAR